jgi:hypothetical protein
MEGMALHQMLHLLEVGGILFLTILTLKALARPKLILKEVVKGINDMQIKGGK